MNHREIVDKCYNLGFSLSQEVLLDIVWNNEEWQWMPFSTSEYMDAKTLDELSRLLNFINGK